MLAKMLDGVGGARMDDVANGLGLWAVSEERWTTVSYKGLLARRTSLAFPHSTLVIQR